VNTNNLSRVQKVTRDGDRAAVTSGGRQYHTSGPAAENAQLPMVEWWTGGWTKQLVQEERSPRRLGRSEHQEEQIFACVFVKLVFILIMKTNATS